MRGHFSRLSFDPRRHLAAVLDQQGSVGLDADQNEGTQILLHRLAAQNLDIIGTCGRPRGAPGLDLSVAGNTIATATVLLSEGRFYAGGLLVELEHQLDFKAQPDWPIPTQPQWTAINNGELWPGLDLSALVLGGSMRRDLFYVEAWLRHKTALNDEAERQQAADDASAAGLVGPDWDQLPEVGSLIRERALGGPETCTRLQTVAQVKYWTLVDEAITDCGGACAALATARPPNTTGMLRVTVSATTAPIDPCTEPLAGGYAGAENRMYRVEIHDQGGVGTATFKWSSENGAMVVRVTDQAYSAIAAGGDIVIQSKGDDETTALRANDWVELCGEDTELGVWHNPLAQLAADPAPQTDGTWKVQLTRNVVVPRAPFLRRWADDAQTITALSTPFPLSDDSAAAVTFFDEHGGSNGQVYFHELDYWTWSGRAITREIDPEAITKRPQPVQGIERDYCCLGIVTWRGPHDLLTATIDPCLDVFPPLTNIDGCCTRVVHPGEDIQAALDSLTGQGGCVCLKTGVHTISQALRIRRSNVVLHGEAPGAVVRHSAGPLMIRIASDDESTIDNVRVEEIRFEATDDGRDSELIGVAMIEVHRLADGALRHCALASAAATRSVASLGALVSDCGRVTLDGNRMENLLGGVVVLRSGSVDVTRNLFLGPTKDIDSAPVSVGLVGIEYDDEAVGPASIIGNRVDNYRSGILVGTNIEGALVRENHVTRNGPAFAGGLGSMSGAILAADVGVNTPPTFVPTEITASVTRFFAIDVAGARTSVVGNAVNLTDPRHGGIRLRGDQQRATHNVVRSDLLLQAGAAPPTLLPLGIVVADSLTDHPLADCCVEANILSGLQNAITLGGAGPSTAPVITVARARVRGNRIDGSAELVSQLGDPFVNPESTMMFEESSLETTLAAIASNYAIWASQRDGLVSGNLITAVATGVYLAHGERNRVSDNWISAGITGIVTDFETATQLRSNAIHDTPLSGIHQSHCTSGLTHGNTVSGAVWFGLGLGAGSDNQVVRNVVTGGGVGIWAGGETRLIITGNTVERMRSAGIVGYQCLGDVRCTHNSVAWCGSEGTSRSLITGSTTKTENTLAVGLMVLDTLKAGDLTVESCHITGTGRAGDEDGAPVFSQSTYGMYVVAQGRCRILANRIVAAEGLIPDVAHWGILALSVAPTNGAPADRLVGMQLLDNAITGTTGSLVAALAPEDITFAHNRCEHYPLVTAGSGPAATVQLVAPLLTVAGNHVRATDSAVPSFTTSGGYLSAVGNVASGAWSVQPLPPRFPVASVKPGPIDQFNQLNVP